MARVHWQDFGEFASQQALARDDQEKKDCLQALKTSTYEQFKNINPKRVDRTCQWVLKDSSYLNWACSDSNTVLWISADPGCGKSVLSKALVDGDIKNTITEKNPVICHFFFKDNDEQNNLRTALCAVLHQLFSHLPELLKHAIPAYRIHGAKLVGEDDELWRILLEASSHLGEHNVFCVFDALDECREADRNRLISKLETFYESPMVESSRLKFLVTSRPYDDIQMNFKHLTQAFPEIHLCGEERNEEIREEVDLVVQARVNRLVRELNLKATTGLRLESYLRTMEHRTYLWLYLAMDDIRRTLKNSLRPDKATFTWVPDSVEAAYERILNHIDSDQVPIAKTIFRIIIGARRPLGIDEMSVALGLTTEQESRTIEEATIPESHLQEQIRGWCGLFIFFNDSRIFLIHQTAREFLLASPGIDPTAETGWKHHLRLLDAEYEMTRICVLFLHLQYLERELRSSTGLECGDPSCTHTECHTQPNTMSTRVFSAYVYFYWDDHFRQADLPVDHDLTSKTVALYGTEEMLSESRFIASASFEDEDMSLFQLRSGFFDMKFRGTSPLHLAVLNRHINIVQRILQKLDLEHKKNLINLPGKDSESALIWVSKNGCTTMVTLLLGHGGDANAKTRAGTPVLHIAGTLGHLNVVKELLNHGADTNANDQDCCTALQNALSGKTLEVAQELLDRVVDVNAKGKPGSALQVASRYQWLEGVELLLNRGAHVDPEYGINSKAPKALMTDRPLGPTDLLSKKGQHSQVQGSEV